MVSRSRLLSVSEHVGLWGCGLFALVSPAWIVRDPLWGSVGLLFSGGGFAVLIHEWRVRAADAVVAEIRDITGRVARHDLDGYRRLVAKLRPLRGRRAAGALVVLSGCAKLLDGLFFHARRREIEGLPETGEEPLAWALASLHPDGHVRADAVAAMGRAPQPEFVPFLVERAVERVDAVRGAALSALREMLADESAREPVARSFSRVAGRQRAAGIAGLLDPGPDGPGPDRPGLGRCTPEAFALCGARFRRCAVDEHGRQGTSSLAPTCCGNESVLLGHSCRLVVRQRLRWARTQSSEQHSETP
jgi:hypothetical protein